METLEMLAHSQAGLFTTSQALALGWDARALLAGVRRGGLKHLGRGLYALPSPDLDTPDGWLRALSRGGLLLYPDSAHTQASAALAHGLPLLGRHRRASLARPVASEVQTQSFVIRPHRGEPVVLTDLGPAVTPAWAVAQLTMDCSVIDGVVAADAALHRGLFRLDDLADVAAAVKGWPRSARLSTLATLLDGRSESVGESRLRVILRLAHIDVLPQSLVRDESGRVVARVDFLVDGTNVVIEFDGLVKYTDGGVDALIAEKRREDRLRSLGYVVIRVTWDELARPAVLLARIRAVLRQPHITSVA
ncbi:MAG: type IV toxin-antitoxin system AbiEi family antitoxin domain-containing protein [Lapillicoccus sp.]